MAHMSSLSRRESSCQKKGVKQDVCVGRAFGIRLRWLWDSMRYSKTKYRLYHSIPYSNIHILSFDVIYFLENAWSLDNTVPQKHQTNVISCSHVNNYLQNSTKNKAAGGDFPWWMWSGRVPQEWSDFQLTVWIQVLVTCGFGFMLIKGLNSYGSNLTHSHNKYEIQRY